MVKGMTPSGGPKNRYTKAASKQRRTAERARDDKRLEELADQGFYTCADCGRQHTIEAFQYVYDGETKVARRCESCRAVRRASRRYR